MTLYIGKYGAIKQLNIFAILTFEISNEFLIGLTRASPRHDLFDKIIGNSRNKQNSYEYIS